MLSIHSSPKIVLAGSVNSTRRTLQCLLHHHANVVGVLGLSVEAAKNVSGYTRLDDLLIDTEIPYAEFVNINHPDIIQLVTQWAPDLLFVVGLSQLVKPALLAIPPLGCVGFHPTWLPEGRGRAPVAWLTMGNQPGAATFFLMDDGVDSGPILAQQPFMVTAQDYASDTSLKMEQAIEMALDAWLPRLLAGEWNPQPQNDALATYHGRRAPTDGLINWPDTATNIQAVIRATSRPHPGAYTYFRNHKIIVWRAEIERALPFKGVVGRVLLVDSQKGKLIQTGDGLLWLTEMEFADTNSTPLPEIGVGMKLGYSVEDEIFRLRQKIAELELKFAQLAQRIGA